MTSQHGHGCQIFLSLFVLYRLLIGLTYAPSKEIFSSSLRKVVDLNIPIDDDDDDFKTK